MQIPADLTGKRILDVGAASGWNSFELERREAEVMATGCVDYPELRLAKAALQARVDYLILDIDELSPASIRTGMSTSACTSAIWVTSPETPFG